MSKTRDIDQQRMMRLQVLMKELEVSCNGFQQRTAVKAMMVTVCLAALGIVSTLYIQKTIDERFLFLVPFALLSGYLAYWNHDFNHVVYRCCVRITEAKVNALLGETTFTWGRDHYNLARSRRPLKHVFNSIIALVFLSLISLSAFKGSIAVGFAPSRAKLWVVGWCVVFIISLFMTNRAVQLTKRQTDKMVSEITEHGRKLMAIEIPSSTKLDELPTQLNSEPTHQYGIKK
jgi:hypothetical protein